MECRTYNRVLIPLDGSELAEQALAYLEKLSNGATLVILLRVVEPPITLYASGGSATRTAKEMLKWAKVEATRYLREVAQHLEQQGLKVKTVVTVGYVEESITKYAANNDVGLIVMSTHGGSGHSQWLHGSVTEKLVRHSRVPVLVFPPVPGVNRRLHNSETKGRSTK